MVTLLSLLHLSVFAGLDAQTELMCDFGDAFLKIWKRKCPKFKRYSCFLCAHTRKRHKGFAGVNKYSLASLTTLREAACARASTVAHAAVSGPALVRTAPAFQNPWNPNLHAPAQLHVTHSGSDQSERERCFTRHQPTSR